MNRYLRYGLWVIAGIFVLGAGLATYLTLTFDPNSYKPQIINAVKTSKQRTLSLNGDIKLHFFPSIGVSLSKVSLSEFRSEKQFLSVDSASVSLEVLPLLARHIVVNEVAVSGVKAHVVEYKDGTTNLDDLLGRQTAPAAAPAAPPASTGTSSPPMLFDIASVQLDHTDLTYRDERSGAQYSVRDLSLKTGRIANDVPANIDFAAHIQSNQPSLDINTQIKTMLTFNLDKGSYQVQGLDLQASGKALDIADLLMTASGDASAQLAAQEISMSKFVLTARGTKGKDKFEAGFNAPALSLTKEKFSGDGIALNAKLDGTLGNMIAMLSLPGIEGNANSFKVSKAALDIDLKQPEQTFKVKIASPVTGSMAARQFNLSDLDLLLNASGDKLPGKTINSEMKGSVQADLDRQYVEVNLAGGLLQSQLKAKASVKNFKTPSIRYDLEVDQFDADPYMPQKTAAATAGQSSARVAVPEQPFDLSALKTLNVEGSVRIGSLKAANVKLAQLRVDVKARNGLVNIAPLSARLYQGSIGGKASVDANSSSFAVDEKLTGVDVAPLLKDAANLEAVEGKGNIALDLTSQGNTVGGLKKALNGKVSVDLANGAIRGIDLEKLVQGLQNLSKTSSTQTLGVDKSAKTPFSVFKATFKVHNGVAHNDDLAVRSTVLRVTGKGDIDVGRDKLDYNAKAIFAKTEQGKTATLPVNVSGGFDDPKFRVDYGALLADVARQRLDEKKEDLKARAREELKKSLKGLFK